MVTFIRFPTRREDCMPATIAILTKEGLSPADYEASSLEDADHWEPDGIYTVGRTFGQEQAVLFGAHLDRLQESAKLESIPLELDREAIRVAMRTLLKRADYEHARFRITVPRLVPSRITITLEPLQGVPAKLKKTGVSVATFEITRPNPRAKTNVWIERREEALQQLPDGIYEAIMVNERAELLEGFSSNFYAVLEDRLYTARLGILHGIARQIVLSVAPAVIPIQMRPVRKEELSTLSEAFLTSSSRGVVPIIRVDDLPIGGGSPGGHTEAISAAYDDWVENHLEFI